MTTLTLRSVLHNIRLRLSISAIFLLLIIPVFVAFILYSYKTNYLIYKKNAVDLVNRANHDSIHHLVEFLDPIADAARVTAKLVASNPELIDQEKLSEHIIVNLENNENIVSYFVASKEGSFRQIQRAYRTIPVGDRIPPEGAKFVSWVIDRSKGQPGVSTYTFYKAWGEVIERFSAPTKYDPRVRPFYRGVQKNLSEGKPDAPYLDEPFFAISTKQAVIGTTFPILVNQELLGTVTAQVQVKAFGDFLVKNKISKNSETIIFNPEGEIVVHPDSELGFKNQNGLLSQRKVDDLEGSPASMAKKLHDLDGANEIEFEYGEKKARYLAVFNAFAADYVKPWRVMTVVPLDDFIVELKKINQRLVLFALGAFSGIALLTFYFSKLISRPLEGLTTQIQDILAFRNFESAPVASSIYEISTLAQAIKRLKSTVAAFTSYVPRDLVNDLLSSGKSLELGGESRYLTILFTDLKDFSALSEITPSRELLIRVSSYLELMTLAIKEESGTVDKFIGDSVMAFWGAPLLNQNHAYHACVAAVKAQRRMVSLNEKLISEGKSALTVRIGIHSDAVLVGNIGSTERLSYTVMGDGVNIASRLEGINKEFDTRICVSHSLFKEAGERLWVRPIDQIVVKGRKSELLIYELVGIRDGDSETAATKSEQALCNRTTEAYEYYKHGDYVKAKSKYEAIAAEFGDGLSGVMVSRCEEKLRG